MNWLDMNNYIDSTYFVKSTVATKINRCLLLVFGLTGIITLIPHITNDHEVVILNRGVGGAFILSLYT
jgi:hypothetical protein